jgi:ABC-type transport system involved in cytochrome c biogenesis ATPase subunit
MKITSLKIQNFRSFESMGPIELEQINVIVGPNNTGKSSILRALHLLQAGGENIYADVRVPASMAEVIIGLEDIYEKSWAGATQQGKYHFGKVKINLASNDRLQGSISHYFINPEVEKRARNIGSDQINPIVNREPYHFIVPYLSKRKVAGYDENVSHENALVVKNNFSSLAAKLSRLATPGFPGHEIYRNTCTEILGFMVAAIPSTNGQRPGVYVLDRQTLPIDQMGEGVANIVALLADLALSSEKLFLIEEPENDLHPQALKALLDLIVESTQRGNQFVISTHSNIVVRYLASQPKSKLYNVTTELDSMPPKAIIREVEPTVEARLTTLRDLGYSFSDFDLWDGWLILEEASAERIIRDYLIPWFAPKLTRIRTISVGGVSQVEPTFVDFNRLVRFTHLEQAYRNVAWVRVDGDKDGKETIEKLQKNYKNDWDSDRFMWYAKEQFEHYYPSEFSDEVNDVLSISNKKDRQEAKKKLGDKVRAWIDADEERGRIALQESAEEVISDLQLIEKQLFKT